MAQQNMEFEEANRDESRPPYGAYEGTSPSYDSYRGTPAYNNPPLSTHGQKLFPQSVGQPPSAGQRLALAIVSLSLWIVLFFLIAIGTASTSHDGGMLGPVLLIGLFIFSALVIIINVLFNRKQ